MLIVLKCTREFYCGVCFFPRKNFNHFLLFIFETLITLASLSNEEKLNRSAGDDVMGDTIFGKGKKIFFVRCVPI